MFCFSTMKHEIQAKQHLFHVQLLFFLQSHSMIGVDKSIFLQVFTFTF